ncbi:MAG: 4'-phosphopantetheinyl transferase superfamily protein [Bellilinea sp.]|jgi:4'-phosphopantetheinyl transferase
MTLGIESGRAVQIFWGMSEAVPLLEHLTPSSFSWLSNVEIQRVNEFRYPKRRLEWLRGRWVAKQLLLRSDPQFEGCQPSQITVVNAPQGAPQVWVAGESAEGSLSISHSRDKVAAAWSPFNLAAVGVDVEWIEPRHPAFLEDFFTETEKLTVLATPAEHQALQVTLLWSAKEAALKALGLGLRVDSRLVEIVSPYRAPIGDWQDLLFSSALLKNQALVGRWKKCGSHICCLTALSPVVNIAAVEWVEVRL